MKRFFGARLFGPVMVAAIAVFASATLAGDLGSGRENEMATPEA